MYRIYNCIVLSVRPGIRGASGACRTNPPASAKNLYNGDF
jgi:hypothetical protein